MVLGYYYLMYQEGRMDLSELFNKISDEDDISSESALFDFQEAAEVLNRARMGEIDTGKISKLFMPLAKVASEQLETLMHYKDVIDKKI